MKSRLAELKLKYAEKLEEINPGIITRANVPLNTRNIRSLAREISEKSEIITKIDLSGANLTADHLFTIMPVIAQCTQLISLNISNNPMLNTFCFQDGSPLSNEDMDEMLSTNLENLSHSIRHLNLSGISIDSGFNTLFINLIKTADHLNSLSLSDGALNNILFQEIIENTSLTKLILNNYNIYPQHPPVVEMHLSNEYLIDAKKHNPNLSIMFNEQTAINCSSPQLPLKEIAEITYLSHFIYILSTIQLPHTLNEIIGEYVNISEDPHYGLALYGDLEALASIEGDCA